MHYYGTLCVLLKQSIKIEHYCYNAISIQDILHTVVEFILFKYGVKINFSSSSGKYALSNKGKSTLTELGLVWIHCAKAKALQSYFLADKCSFPCTGTTGLQHYPEMSHFGENEIIAIHI